MIVITAKSVSAAWLVANNLHRTEKLDKKAQNKRKSSTFNESLLS